VILRAWWVPVAVLCASGLTVGFVIPFLGPDFSPARRLVLPLAVATCVLAGVQYVQAALLAGDRPGTSSKAMTLAMAVSFVVYPVAITVAGAEGAAWGSLVVYSVALISSSIFLRRGNSEKGRS